MYLQQHLFLLVQRAHNPRLTGDLRPQKPQYLMILCVYEATHFCIKPCPVSATTRATAYDSPVVPSRKQVRQLLGQSADTLRIWTFTVIAECSRGHGTILEYPRGEGGERYTPQSNDHWYGWHQGIYLTALPFPSTIPRTIIPLAKHQSPGWGWF